MPIFHGAEYNYEIPQYPTQPNADFNRIMRAGESVEDFTLPALEGTEVTLFELQGKPVLIEFGFAS